jgi:glucose-1-phosphate thymidylyltransferase long form
MRAVVLAAGTGTRMRPLTYAKPKHMLTIAGKPVLEHTLDFLRLANIQDVCIVVGYLREVVMDYFGDGDRFDMNITYAHQEKRLGLAHALKYAQPHLKNDNFVMVLGDVMIRLDLKEMVEHHLAHNAVATIGLATVDDPTPFGVVKMDEDLRISKLIEKPKVPPSNYVITGLYIFDNEIFSAIDKIPKSWRGEYEITDAIQLLVEQGDPVYGYPALKYWKDTGRPTDLLEANKKFLSDYLGNYIVGEVHQGCEIDGIIRVEKGSVLHTGVKIHGPVSIGEDSFIGPNCELGPYVQIGSNVRLVENVTLANTIIMNNTLVSNDAVLKDSIIGEKCQIGPEVIAEGTDNVFGVVIADHSVVGPNITFTPGNTLGPHSTIQPQPTTNKNQEGA